MGLPSPSLSLSRQSWRFGGWHPTPWYDWHRYCGGNMRCWVWDEEGLMFEYDGEWTYRSFQEHARDVLKEASDVGS